MTGPKVVLSMGGDADTRLLIRDRPDRPAPVSDVLHGRKIERVIRTKTHMIFHTMDGYEVRIAWIDAETSKPVVGVPVMDPPEPRRWK